MSVPRLRFVDRLRQARIYRCAVTFLCVCIPLGNVSTTNAAATITIHIPGFNLVNQFSLPAGVPGALGDVLFSADGNTLFILGGSEGSNSGVWSVPVTRDPSGNVIGLGAATALFAIPGMDTSLELKPGTGTLFFRMTGGRVGERRPDGTIAIFDAAGASSYGGLAFVPNPLPNAGDLLVGNWSGGVINSHSLTDNLDGTFTPVLQGFYSNSQSGATGDSHFIPTSAFANDLMFTNWSSGTVSIIDIDPATGLPLGGGSTPSITLFASGLGAGPWGLDFDPISGNLFIANWVGMPSNGFLQISGFTAPCPWDVDGSGSVDRPDLLLLLASWRTNPGGPPDFDGDGQVAVPDLLQMLARWGSCP